MPFVVHRRGRYCSTAADQDDRIPFDHPLFPTSPRIAEKIIGIHLLLSSTSTDNNSKTVIVRSFVVVIVLSPTQLKSVPEG